MAPELRRLDFWEGDGVNSGSNEGKIASLQVPLDRQGINSHQWGEASFTGPSHDIIVCDVNGRNPVRGLFIILNFYLLFTR